MQSTRPTSAAALGVLLAAGALVAPSRPLTFRLPPFPTPQWPVRVYPAGSSLRRGKRKPNRKAAIRAKQKAARVARRLNRRRA